LKKILLPVLLFSALVLSACSATSTPIQSDSQDQPVLPSSTIFPARIDQQGAIIIEVTPLNLNSPADTLEFDVVLTTHSIDLSMDLAKLSTLTTDMGVSMKSTLWDAPLGDHHAEGKLIFPATKDGKSILEGAIKLTLTIRNGYKKW
jgi:hypothetical protein